jgi:hypothetical protein
VLRPGGGVPMTRSIIADATPLDHASMLIGLWFQGASPTPPDLNAPRTPLVRVP